MRIARERRDVLRGAPSRAADGDAELVIARGHFDRGSLNYAHDERAKRYAGVSGRVPRGARAGAGGLPRRPWCRSISPASGRDRSASLARTMQSRSPWPDETDGAWRATFSLDPAQPLVTSIGAGRRRRSSAARARSTRARPGSAAAAGTPSSTIRRAHPDGTRHVQGTLHAARRATARSVGERAGDRVRRPAHGQLRAAAWPTRSIPAAASIQQEAVLTTNDADVAYYYDAGLDMAAPGRSASRATTCAPTSPTTTPTARCSHITLDGLQAERVPVQARYRTLALKTAGGSVAVFPAPHQYFFPRDFTSNLGLRLVSRLARAASALGITAAARRELAILPVDERAAGTAAADERVLPAVAPRRRTQRSRTSSATRTAIASARSTATRR